MSEVDKTNELLEELLENDAKFADMVSDISAVLKPSYGELLTIPKIEDAIKRGYARRGMIPPETDIVQYVFQDLVDKKRVAINDLDLTRLLRSLFAEQKIELYRRYFLYPITMHRSGNTMVVITRKVTGASWLAVWLFPIIALVFFIAPYLPLIGRLTFLTRLLRKVAVAYTGILAPGYDTYKTIEHRSGTNPEKMLSYWLVLALAYTGTEVLRIIVWDDLFALVFYLTVLGITIWDYFFAVQVYRFVVRPIINFLRSTYGVVMPAGGIQKGK